MLLLSITFIDDIFNIHSSFACTDQQGWFCWSQLSLLTPLQKSVHLWGFHSCDPCFPLTDVAWEISFFGSLRKYKRISKGWGCLLRQCKVKNRDSFRGKDCPCEAKPGLHLWFCRWGQGAWAQHSVCLSHARLLLPIAMVKKKSVLTPECILIPNLILRSCCNCSHKVALEADFSYNEGESSKKALSKNNEPLPGSNPASPSILDPSEL